MYGGGPYEPRLLRHSAGLCLGHADAEHARHDPRADGLRHLQSARQEPALGRTAAIEKVIPDYAGHAKEIADKVLTHNALSHTLGRYAVAIRPQELALVLKDFAESTPAQGDALGKTLKDAATAVTAKAEAAGSNVLAWFNTIMDRTTERFVIHTRVVTAFFAFGLAFALHIDTMHIVAQLRASPKFAPPW